MLLCNRKDPATATCGNTDDSEKHCAKSQKPDTNAYILYDSLNLTFWKNQSCKDRKLIGGCQSIGEGRKGLTVGAGGSFLG